MKILFVCYGNKCRSPMAEGMAKKMLKGIAHVESAGIAAWGSNASEEAIKVMKKEFGIDISGHKPKDIKNLSLSNFDYMVTMDSYIDTTIRKGYQIESNKIISWNINDPYGKSIDDYKKCAITLQTHIKKLLTKILI
jgi:ribose 5-phosphate isomerase B